VNYDRIELGWTSQQVVQLLNTSPSTRIVTTWDDELRSTTAGYCNEDGASIIVIYDHRDCVTEKVLIPAAPLSFFESVKRRIERRIQALLP
jgi:hypothetical protein